MDQAERVPISVKSLKKSTWLTGSLARDVPDILLRFGRRVTADHSQRVADEARRVARLVGVDVDRAVTAAWLHDISAVVPVDDRVGLALELGLEVLPEERQHPGVLHQKLSATLAEELFGITDPAVLAAIACHTTLRASADTLDMVLYVADKLAWDQSDAAPFEASMRDGLRASLEAAALAHLRWTHEQRASLPVVHPRLLEAYKWLSGERW